MTIPATGGPEIEEHDLNLLAAYAEGRLDREERSRVVAHLTACLDCRDTLAELARGGARLPAWRRVVRTPSTWLPLAAAVILATVVGGSVLRRAFPTSGSPLSGPELPVERDSSPAPPDARAGERPATPRVEPSSAGRPELDERLLVRRGATRSAAGKTFRWVAGEWVDGAYDPVAALPVVEAKGPGEIQALVERVPALHPYDAFGERVVVVLEGRVYRLVP